MHRARFLVLVFLALSVPTGCTLLSGKEEETVTPAEARQEIDALLARFVAEAEARGRTSVFGKETGAVVATVQVLVTEVIDPARPSTCGFGSWSETAPRIQIAISKRCWGDLAAEDREALVFHELGHAVLARQHDDRRLPNGSWHSMMTPGSLRYLYSGGNLERRSYYLDELFDSNTPPPAWGEEA